MDPTFAAKDSPKQAPMEHSHCDCFHVSSYHEVIAILHGCGNLVSLWVRLMDVNPDFLATTRRRATLRNPTSKPLIDLRLNPAHGASTERDRRGKSPLRDSKIDC
jgi:hypothetical protein